MKIVSMTCPNCGATLQVDADNNKATCSYCGNSLFIDDEVNHVKIDNPEQVGYDFEKGRQRAQAEQYYTQPNSYVAPSNYAPQKRRKTWLWVLGWLFIFPLPLTIILVHKKDMKPILKYGIIVAAWIFYLIICLTGGNNQNKEIDKPDSEVEIVSETTTNTEQQGNESSKQDSLIMYYKYNEDINFYVNRFNESNPDNMLLTEDIYKYSMSNGRELDDQVSVYRNGFHIVMRKGMGGDYEVLVRYNPNTKRNNDEMKQIFIQFAKPYNPELSTDILSDYWEQIVNGMENYKDDFAFDGFDCECGPSSSHSFIESFTLSGSIK